jgi:predicted DsbA family dithiol-disulfide isomerase
MDHYLSVPGSYAFVRRAPEGAVPDRVSMTVFEDFLCPVCYQTASELIPRLKDKYHDRLDVRFIGYPLIHPKSRLPARAYAIAHEFGLSEQMQRALFRAQFEEQLDTTSRDGLARVAHSIGLDPELLLARLDDDGGSAEVERNLALGESYHIDAVPGIILDGWIRVTTLSLENLETIIDGILEKKRTSP